MAQRFFDRVLMAENGKTPSMVAITSKEAMDKKKPPESARKSEVHFLIETEQEEDGRWIAEIAEIPGVLTYGGTEDQARANAYALALHITTG